MKTIQHYNVMKSSKVHSMIESGIPDNKKDKITVK